MLKGECVNVRVCPEELKEYLWDVFSLIDSVEQTIYSAEFYYIHIDQQLYSVKELANILNLSYTTLHVHMRKLNKFIEKAIMRMKVRQ